MKGDIALAGFMMTAEEWQALDIDTRTELVSAVSRRFAVGTQPPASLGSATSAVDEARLADGSGPTATDDYVDLFDD